MSKDFKAVIRADCERAAEWLKVFGTLEVCLESPLPVLANLPGFDESQMVYMLDLKQITPEERTRMVESICRRFPPLLADEVEQMLDEQGVPILASDCWVVVENPQRWF